MGEEVHVQVVGGKSTSAPIVSLCIHVKRV